MTYPLLLKAALSSNPLDNDLEFTDGRLTGECDLPLDSRMRGAQSLFGVSSAYERIERNSSNNKIYLSPQKIDPEKVISAFEVDSPIQLILKHGLAEKDGGLCWDIPHYVEEPDGYWKQVERVKFTFLSLENEEPAGFFGFDISFKRTAGDTEFCVDLKLIYVRPQFRHFGIHGLDLSCAVTDLSIAIYLEILKRYRGKTPVEVVVGASISSKGGERIANLIHEELDLAMYSFKNGTNYRRIAKKVGGLEPDFGESIRSMIGLKLDRHFEYQRRLSN